MWTLNKVISPKVIRSGLCQRVTRLPAFGHVLPMTLHRAGVLPTSSHSTHDVLPTPLAAQDVSSPACAGPRPPPDGRVVHFASSVNWVKV